MCVEVTYHLECTENISRFIGDLIEQVTANLFSD